MYITRDAQKTNEYTDREKLTVMLILSSISAHLRPAFNAVRRLTGCDVDSINLLHRISVLWDGRVGKVRIRFS